MDHPPPSSQRPLRLALLFLCLCCVAACGSVATRSTGPAPAELRVLSWNMEWLADPAELVAADYWRGCAAMGHANRKPRDDLPFCDVYPKKGIESATDYEARKLVPLRRRLAELAAVRELDVIAVQEVQNAAALEAVLPAGYRVACFTTRTDPQNVGFAVREGLAADAMCSEVRTLALENEPTIDHPLRRGLALELKVRGGRVTLLAVHLKSGCPGGPMDSTNRPACRALQRQVAPLEQWVETQARAGRPFMIVGDWNRDLEAEIRGGYPARTDASDPAGPMVTAQVRNIWPEIADGSPPQSAMELVTMDRIAATGRACHRNLDQIVLSTSLKALLDPASLQEDRQRARFETRPVAASDHCPMSTRLVFGGKPGS